MSTMFELASGGIGVMPDPADNPDNHVNPHHEAVQESALKGRVK